MCIACLAILMKILIGICISAWVLLKSNKAAILAIALILLAFLLSKIVPACDLDICKPLGYN